VSGNTFLNWTVRATDGYQSGIAYVKVVIEDDDGPLFTLENASLTDEERSDVNYEYSYNLTDAGIVRPGKRFFLNFTIQDRAGNAFVGERTDATDIAPAPLINLNIPKYIDTSIFSSLPINLSTTFANFADTPEHLRIRIYNTSDGALRKEWNETATNNSSRVRNFDDRWNVSTFLGAHNLSVESWSGRGYTRKVLNFTILQRPTAGSTANISTYETLSDTAGAVTRHAYRVRHEPGCGPAFTLNVDGPIGTDFNLYMNETAPNDPSSPAQYTHAETSTNRSEQIHYRGPVPGWTYSVLVEQASGPATTYRLRYTTFAASGSTCENGVPKEPLPENRITDHRPLIDDVQLSP